jgi:hypothetical protein
LTFSFSFYVESAADNVRLELPDLQADRELKHKSVSVKLSDIFLLFGE